MYEVMIDSCQILTNSHLYTLHEQDIFRIGVWDGWQKPIIEIF